VRSSAQMLMQGDIGRAGGAFTTVSFSVSDMTLP